MDILVETQSAEQIIKGSTFLSEAFYVDSQAQVRELIKSQKTKYQDATHVCHAFIIGKNAEIMGMSDDGEPSGTAGRPMLDILKGRNITNILVTVTRWFGGTLLGTGGLVHAYGDGVKAVLENTIFEPLIDKSDFSLVCDYQMYQIVKKVFENYTLYETSEDFGSEIVFKGKIATIYKTELSSIIFDKTNGKVKVN